MDYHQYQKCCYYVGWLSLATPGAQYIQLKSLQQTQPTMPWRRFLTVYRQLAIRQVFLRSWQLGISTTVTQHTHPFVGFGIFGLTQSIMYGDCNNRWWSSGRSGGGAHSQRWKTLLRSSLRAPYLSVTRDVISQGIPFYFASSAHNHENWAKLLTWSFTSTVVSQPIHNVQTLLSGNKSLTLKEAVHKIHRERQHFKGVGSRILLLSGINVLNFVYLKKIWQ